VAQILYEGMPGGDGARGRQAFKSAHRPEPGLEPAVYGFDRVIRVLLGDMPRGRHELVEHPRIDRRSIAGQLDGWQATAQRAGKECSWCGRVATCGRQRVDDLAVLVERAVQVSPASGDLDVGLVDEPALPGCMAGWPGRSDELRRKGVHPPI